VSGGSADRSAASTLPSSIVNSRSSNSGSPPFSSASAPGTKVTCQSPAAPAGAGASHSANRSSKSSPANATGAKPVSSATSSAAAGAAGAADAGAASGEAAATSRASIAPSAGGSPPSRAAVTWSLSISNAPTIVPSRSEVSVSVPLRTRSSSVSYSCA
jgi:hypothetical protein